MKQRQTLLFKKIYGCLAGGAIGDAMGGVTEMMLYPTIQRLFGQVTDLIERGKTYETARFSPGEAAGVHTDDTRLTQLLCQAIIKNGGRVTAEDLAETWREHMSGWFLTPVLNSYYKVVAGDSKPREAGRGNMGSNSSSMSISPVGLINAGNPRQAAQDAYDVASLVHEGYARDAACCVAAAVAEACNPEATVESVLEAATAYLSRLSDLIPYVERALALARNSQDYEDFRARFYEQCLLPWPQTNFHGNPAPEGFYDTAEPRETIPTALALFYLASGDYRQSVIYATNFGRDSDTLAAIVGGINGAYQGEDGIPVEWLRKVSEANPTDMEDLARQMYESLLKEVELMEKHLARVRRLNAETG